MRILLTGIHGQVGFELLSTLAPLGEIIPCDRAALNLSNPEAIRAVVRAERPDLIVNPAAYTAVDHAETDAQACEALNVTAVRVLGEEAERLGAVMIHYSTDYVFDGSGDRPWREEDPTGPLNVYGATKLAGERALAAACSQHLILRTSWVYGLRGSNFLLTMLRLGRERPHLRVVADQIGAPTWSRLIAERTAALVARQVICQPNGTAQASTVVTGLRARLKCAPGVVHLTAAGATSWAGFAKEIFKLADLPTAVEEIPASDYPTPARRPANSRLDLSRAEHLIGVPMEGWKESLARCLTGMPMA